MSLATMPARMIDADRSKLHLNRVFTVLEMFCGVGECYSNYVIEMCE